MLLLLRHLETRALEKWDLPSTQSQLVSIQLCRFHWNQDIIDSTIKNT